MPYMKINHEVDPKQKILDDLGPDLHDQIAICNANVLVAVYQRPTTTMLGGKQFYVADRVMDEDRYQSKVGLVIATGPDAFKDPNGHWFTNGPEIKLHDWVVIPSQAVRTMMINGVLCRLVNDQNIDMVIDDCDRVY